MQRPSISISCMILLNMLFAVIGVAIFAAVALQIQHHVKTGGKLFFKAPKGCKRMPSGALECIGNSTETTAEILNALLEPQKGLEQKQDDSTAKDAIAEQVAEDEEPLGNDEERNVQQADPVDDNPQEPTTDSRQEPALSDPVMQSHPQPDPTADDLHHAAHEDQPSLLQQYLLKNPDLVNTSDHNQWTALHVAARAGFTDSVRILLAAGADVKLETSMGKTAFDIATESLEPDHAIVRLLSGPVLVLPNGGGLLTADEFRAAADRGQIEQVEHFLAAIRETRNTDILDHSDGNKWNALHMAARSGHVHIVKLLLDAGASVSLQTANERTALTLAKEYHGDDSEIVSILRSVVADEL
ncbi:hypothetical protein MPSEU_000848100 [Mayamaea pseudoterrestris]|nr:hypothetical protein MPSEU_000848100 [Mayamaea pseudoterrestris]